MNILKECGIKSYKLKVEIMYAYWIERTRMAHNTNADFIGYNDKKYQW